MKGAPRKLRKSCSLPTCSKTPGECMHCTCDGRCGQHDAGLCGVRREGNGKSCKRDGCAKDDSCLHSTRATCCHCRNLVSSSNRSSRKRTRADLDLPTVAPLKAPVALVEDDDDENDDENDDDEDLIAVPKQIQIQTGEDADGQSSPTSCDALLPLSADIFGDFEICDDLLVVIKKPRIESNDALAKQTAALQAALPQETKPVEPLGTLSTKSLMEYDQYKARRNACNLVVVVEGTQFNLHKHPMLLESQMLNSKARESVLTTRSPVPFVQLTSFPGGAAAFETLCVYAYTGELNFTPETAAALYCGIQFLHMGLAASTLARTYLNTITEDSSNVDALLQVSQDASELMNNHDSLSVCAELHLECVDSLARVVPLELAVIEKLLHLPIELFLQVTQEMLATRGPRELAMDMVRQLCVQAGLAQFHRDATEKKEASASQRCLQELIQALTPVAAPSAQGFPGQDELKNDAMKNTTATSDEDYDDAMFMKMMCDFDVDPSSDEEGVDGTSSFADALSAAALEPFAFASRGVSSHRGTMTAAFAV